MGTIDNGTLDYRWEWLQRDLEGKGQMKLSKNKQFLSGVWWYQDNPVEKEEVRYQRVSDAIPHWVSERDFELYENFLSNVNV